MDPSEKQAARYRSKNLMGYIQDKVDVGMTKLRGDEGKKLDVAILKSTLQTEVPPKEKHVVTLKGAASATAPRLQVNYVIHGLVKRVEEKSGWLVTLKTLIVFHRLLREVDPSFQEEIIRYQDRTGAHRMLRLEAFADHTTKDTWDYSAWIRVYSVYLDERLGVFKAMRFDPELDERTGGTGGGASPSAGGAYYSGQGQGQGTQGEGVKETKLKTCPAPELLEKLPLVQRLLNRLIACIPEGAAQNNEIVIQSCVMVLRELRSTYRTVCEGIINLADKFFEMERSDALKGLDIYKDNVALNEKLNTFFVAVNNVPSLRGTVQLPNLQSLPADFLTTMEEYVRDAPKSLDPARVTGGSSGLRGSTTLMRAAGGSTAAAITGTGTGGLPPTIPSPTQGVLKIGPPATDAPAPPPAPAPAPAPSIDLLGDDFSPAPAVQSPPQSQTAGAAGFGPNDAFGAPPAFATPPSAGGPAPGFNPFGPPEGAPVQQPGYGSPPPPVQSFSPPKPQPTGGAYAPPGYPGVPPGQPNPYVPGPPGAYPPPQAAYPGPYPGAPPTGYHAPPPGSGLTASGNNPFGGAAGPVWGAGPPPGATSWGTNVVPGQAALKKSQDPLNDIGLDLFGKPQQAPVQQSLRDMKLQN